MILKSTCVMLPSTSCLLLFTYFMRKSAGLIQKKKHKIPQYPHKNHINSPKDLQKSPEIPIESSITLPADPHLLVPRCSAQTAMPFSRHFSSLGHGKSCGPASSSTWKNEELVSSSHDLLGICDHWGYIYIYIHIIYIYIYTVCVYIVYIYSVYIYIYIQSEYIYIYI